MKKNKRSKQMVKFQHFQHFTNNKKATGSYNLVFKQPICFFWRLQTDMK